VRVSKANRSLVIKRAYRARVEELVGLMDSQARQRTVDSAHKNRLGRKTLKRFNEAVGASPPGPLTLGAADEIAKRYAMWEVRRVFDSGRYPPQVRAQARRVDEALYSGMYELDVTLRRQLEALLRSPAPDSGRAAALRWEVEASAGRLAAAHAVADTADQYHPNWREISERYDDICNDMDALLALAGAPGSDS
jgi:hypothetical protein